jgi:predicted AlkP superfamily pyrophosphatase or phosphodiesterase
VHFTDLDTQRHFHGFSSIEATDAILRHNFRLGRIIEALQECSIYEKSTIVVLGDHSALDETKAINPNVLLRKQNLIKTNNKGKIVNWHAYCKSCDGSAYIYVKNDHDEESINKVANLVNSLLQDPNSGIEKVLTGAEASEKGADGNCAFMLEAKKGYYFLEDYLGEYCKTITENDVTSDKKFTLATHGYSPEKENYHTILMASGKGILPGTHPSIRLVDEGPTFARLLGLSLGNTDGRIIEELLAL